jgi:hypothetical protein
MAVGTLFQLFIGMMKRCKSSTRQTEKNRLYDTKHPLNRFFSGLSDGRPLLNILQTINASNRKKIGWTLLYKQNK